MRTSKLFTKTSKTASADEVAKNAQLLIRAGYVYKVMAGVYAYTPLGLRVLENIKQIVREEMDAIDGQEVIMTSLQPKDLWEKTGRWDDEIVDVWFKSKLKDETEVGFAWSHEEAIMEMLQRYVQSYKDLPTSVYQFQTKLRNELRAKSGIMRGREFVMKDMYSLHASAEDLDVYYDKVKQAYTKIFERLGIGDSTYLTFASGGAFTEFSHEFQTICEAGEDTLYRVPSTGTVFNAEVAPAQAPKLASDGEAMQPMQEVEGKGLIGVEPLAKFLKIDVEKTTKTMLYATDEGKVVAAAVRGRYKIDEAKLAKVVGAKRVVLADEATVKRVTGAEVGYAGLLNLPDEVQVVVDESCADRINFEMGANHTNFHTINANWGRDLPTPEQFYDIKVPQAGDMHPDSGEVYEVLTAAEVGNIFNFGTDKSESMGIYYTGEDGTQKPIYLASYGLGITRAMGVIAEKMADEKGLVWHDNIAPYRVYLARLGAEDEVVEAADKLYESLQESGVTVLYDDRDARPGEKFADADLLGMPHRVVVSAKTVAQGVFEYKKRVEAESSLVSAEKLKSILTV